MSSVSKVWARTRGLIRLARRLNGFLAEPLSGEQASAVVAQGVEQRDARFLNKLQRCISMKIPKARTGGFCRFVDVNMAMSYGLWKPRGLDGALAKLAAAGVYLTFEEFKGRTPIVRGNTSFQFEPDDLKDPTFRAETTHQTGGTSGEPVRFGSSFELTEQRAIHWCLFFAANERLGAPLIFWTPGNSGSIGPQLACAKFNQRLDYWFVSQKMTRISDRAYTSARHWICRRFRDFPNPRYVAYHDTAPVLEAVRSLLGEEGTVSVNTTPSAAVGLSLAAQEKGASLKGLVFLLGAEPLTPARRMTIEASGARTTPLYGSTEAVWTGGQCPFPQHGDEVHVLRDIHAVIPGPPDVDADPDMSRLLFTSLAPLTSKVMLNTDIGDGAQSPTGGVPACTTA